MAATGFFAQKQTSPIGFGIVLAMHGAAFAALLLVKGPEWMDEPTVETRTYNVKDVPPPPPNDPTPVPETQPQAQLSRLDVVKPVVPPREFTNTAPVSEGIVLPPGPIAGNDPRPSEATVVEPERIVTIPPRDPVRTPVRVEAQFDPRFAGAQQPPYPAGEVRREREGTVRVRVTIGPDGRVVAAEKIDATSDDFWDATRRQALSRWRFRPATLDGRPVQSVKVLSIRFRLDG
jgi:protein TonB